MSLLQQQENAGIGRGRRKGRGGWIIPCVVAREGTTMQFGAVTTSFGAIAYFVMQLGTTTLSTEVAATLAIDGSLDVGAAAPSCPKAM